MLWAPADERGARMINSAEKQNHGCSRDSILDFKVIDQNLSR
jgi:hypothetical protein